MIETLISNGRVAEIAVALIAAEAVVLFWRFRRIGKPRQIAPALAGLAAGAALFLALRASLTGTHGVALFLVIALIAHAMELSLRLSRS
jgi:hypothetical protein